MPKFSVIWKRNKLYAVTAEVYPPGVIDGVLVDPEEYFWWLISRSPDAPADDWEYVLKNSGIPAGNPPHVKPTNNGVYGLTQQMDSGGNVRGRIFLPTAVPDSLGYYASAYSPLKDAPGQPGKLLWEWRYLEGPPYVPVTTPDGGNGTTPPNNGLTEQEVQKMIDQSISEALTPVDARLDALEAGSSGVKVGDKIALRTNSGSVVGVVGGGGVEGQAIELINKEEIHAWESFTLEKGE